MIKLRFYNSAAFARLSWGVIRHTLAGPGIIKSLLDCF
jgi:hypothetical protein